mmetsp:Transcript_6230/g.22129  ORF Transcript_6230/g.22129 Transcript_6230/m.22129 type:complete len:255 (+) Transcript_6230:3968-4732(+)
MIVPPSASSNFSSPAMMGTVSNAYAAPYPSLASAGVNARAMVMENSGAEDEYISSGFTSRGVMSCRTCRHGAVGLSFCAPSTSPSGSGTQHGSGPSFSHAVSEQVENMNLEQAMTLPSAVPMSSSVPSNPVSASYTSQRIFVPVCCAPSSITSPAPGHTGFRLLRTSSDVRSLRTNSSSVAEMSYSVILTNASVSPPAMPQPSRSGRLMADTMYIVRFPPCRCSSKHGPPALQLNTLVGREGQGKSLHSRTGSG